MNKKVLLKEIAPVLEEILQSGGEARFTPGGKSMEPMLRGGIDEICLTGIKAALKKYDIPLYKRDGGQFVLHRIIKVRKDGSYNIAGDNQIVQEAGIRHDQCLGKVKGFWRNGKYISCDHLFYQCYCRIWIMLLPVRAGRSRVISILRKGYTFLRRN